MTDQQAPPNDGAPPSRTWESVFPANRLRPIDMLRAENEVMSRIRRRRRRVLVASAVVVGCFLTLVVAVRATHPRDEADFLLAARTGSTLIDLDDQTLVDEGDQACRWLSQQERALWNHGGWFNRDDALGRYVRETRPSTLGVWGTPGQWRESRVDVADAAWSQLCGGTWWWHRPHGPSLSPRSNEYDGD